jgi:hypothetical protein
VLPGRPGPVRGRDPVSWVGPDPAPNWLDVAREYSERWTHQQQIRDAVGIPGLKEPAFMGPVLAVFVHALPRAFAGVAAPTGTTVAVVIARERGWRLAAGTVPAPAAQVTLDVVDAVAIIG